MFFFLFSSKGENCKCLPPLPSLHGLGPTSTSLIRNLRFARDAVMLAIPEKPVSSWEMQGSTRVCQSVAQSMLCSFLGSTWVHSRLAPSTTLHRHAGSQGSAGPHENGCLERAPLSKQVVGGVATIVGLNEQFLNWIHQWCHGLGSPESKD